MNQLWEKWFMDAQTGLNLKDPSDEGPIRDKDIIPEVLNTLFC